MGSGRVLKVIHTSGNGRLARLTGMECMSGTMEIDMKVNGERASETVMVPISLQTEINT